MAVMYRRIPTFCKSRLVFLFLILTSLILHVLIALLPAQEVYVNVCARDTQHEDHAGPALPKQSALKGRTPKKNRDLQNVAGSDTRSRASQSLEKARRSSSARGQPFTSKWSSKSGSRPDSNLQRDGYRLNTSKLAALFQHPLYKTPPPPLTPDDQLFSVNSAERFTARSSDSDGW